MIVQICFRFTELRTGKSSRSKGPHIATGEKGGLCQCGWPWFFVVQVTPLLDRKSIWLFSFRLLGQLWGWCLSTLPWVAHQGNGSVKKKMVQATLLGRSEIMLQCWASKNAAPFPGPKVVQVDGYWFCVVLFLRFALWNPRGGSPRLPKEPLHSPTALTHAPCTYLRDSIICRVGHVNSIYHKGSHGQSAWHIGPLKFFGGDQDRQGSPDICLHIYIYTYKYIYMYIHVLF